MRRTLVSLALLASIALPAHAQSPSAFTNPQDGNIPDRASHPRAFPTAEGFGKITKVRSADRVVYRVDTLEDVVNANDGKISLRECLTAAAVNTPYVIPANKPRVCVFDVAGQIVVNSAFRIQVPGVYVAGQTAPAPGIEIKMGPLMNPVDTPIHFYRTSDVIVRHVRGRLGAHNDGRPKSQNGDPFRASMVARIIYDHVSLAYGTDESLDMNTVEDATVQWSFLGPNICKDGGHVSSIHCKTLFLKPANRGTVFASLSQHGVHRGMNVAAGVAVRNPDGTWKQETPSQLDVVNNVIFDYTREAGLFSIEFGHMYGNYVNNTTFRSGYMASAGNYPIGLYNVDPATKNGFRIYASGNSTFRTRVAGQFGQTVSDDQRLAGGMISGTPATNVCGLNAAGAKDCSVTGTGVISTTTLALMPGVSALSVSPASIGTSEQAARAVMAFGGANMCRGEWCRDKPDDFWVEDFRTCHLKPRFFDGGILPSGETGYPGYMGGSTYAPLADTDHDGMPDAWETANGLNPLVVDGNADPDGDGYTNLEEYLAAMANDDQRYAGVMASATGALPPYNCGFARTP